MLSHFQSVNFQFVIRNSWARMYCSHSPSTAQVCPSRLLLSDSRMKLRTVESITPHSYPIQRSLNSKNHSPHNTKYCNLLIFQKKKSQNSKTQCTGSITSHPMVCRTWRTSVFMRIGVVLSSQLRWTHTMTPSSDGSSIPSVRRTRCTSVTEPQSSLKSITSHALTTTDPREKVSAHRNTLLSRSSASTFHKACKMHSQTRMCIWLLLHLDQRQCMDRLTVMFCQMENMEYLRW